MATFIGLIMNSKCQQTLIGSAYIFVKDRNLNTIEKAQGKKFAILH